MWKLFVDDERVGPQSPDWTHCSTYEQANQLIELNGMPVEMSLDHDIWIGQINGGKFCHNLRFKPFPEDFSYSIHSSNPEGAEEMRVIMEYLTGKPPKHMTQWW